MLIETEYMSVRSCLAENAVVCCARRNSIRYAYISIKSHINRYLTIDFSNEKERTVQITRDMLDSDGCLVLSYKLYGRSGVIENKTDIKLNFTEAPVWQATTEADFLAAMESDSSRDNESGLSSSGTSDVGITNLASRVEKIFCLRPKPTLWNYDNPENLNKIKVDELYVQYKLDGRAALTLHIRDSSNSKEYWLPCVNIRNDTLSCVFKLAWKEYVLIDNLFIYYIGITGMTEFDSFGEYVNIPVKQLSVPLFHVDKIDYMPKN